MTITGQLTTKKPIENAIREIKEWLDRIDVNGLDVDIRYDARQNISLIRLKYKNKDYEFRSNSQSNCRLNMWAIARVMEFKVRAHLMDIEKFDKSMEAYLQIEAPQGYTSNFQVKSEDRNYVILGISPLSSNQELIKRYKELTKSFHPDMALSSEAKKEFEKRFSEINGAWNKIKEERGI